MSLGKAVVVGGGCSVITAGLHCKEHPAVWTLSKVDSRHWREGASAHCYRLLGILVAWLSWGPWCPLTWGRIQKKGIATITVKPRGGAAGLRTGEWSRPDVKRKPNREGVEEIGYS